MLSAVQQAAHSILALSSANVLVPSPRTPACELVHAACAPPCPDTARRAHDPHPHRRSALRGARVSVIRPYHDATCSRATSHEGWWPFPKAARGGVVRADTGRAAVRHGRINLTNLPARVAPRPVPCLPVRQGQARPASSCPPRQAGRGRAPDACGVQDDTHREDARFFPCVRAFIAIIRSGPVQSSRRPGRRAPSHVWFRLDSLPAPVPSGTCEARLPVGGGLGWARDKRAAYIYSYIQKQIRSS